ncbi:MAG TPA: UDP-N-acetylglucosamine--N-acetylmuramyl-(pentapeptide) pyrophosphoryl-undecaprenol N-acetylglucosamine transferase [Opitutaceae bacterium]
MTFLIACGGTGGHLAPGIALAEGLTARGHQATLVVSHKKIDARLLEKYRQLSFVTIPGAPFAKSPAGLARFAWQQSRGLLFARRLVRRTRPAGIVGFGGFTTAAIILAGALDGVPVALHEANRVPGKAIRRLSRFARRVYLPAGVSLPELRTGVLCPAGLPVRAEIRRHERAAACAGFGLDPRQRVLALLGGSQGASALNGWARRMAAPLARAGVQLYCVTGPGKGATEELSHPGPGGAPLKAVYSPFCDRMAELISAADLVVSRAGAGTIAELIRCGTPAVLVPYPHAADNHQAANAAEFARQGGGLVVAQEKLDELDALVPGLLADDARRADFRANLQRMDRDNALDLILADLEALTTPPPEAGRTTVATA